MNRRRFIEKSLILFSASSFAKYSLGGNINKFSCNVVSNSVVNILDYDCQPYVEGSGQYFDNREIIQSLIDTCSSRNTTSNGFVE
ncbi:hypothetical protein [Klebsiella aerogenes]|uniref:hypothetical protein n=1 Tax=Klebsiella aerogenes TaxID=548 RepID=UPI002FF5961C